MTQALRTEEPRAHGRPVPVARWTTVSSPLGELLVAATDDGLVAVGYGGEDHAATLERLARAVAQRVVASPVGLAAARRELEAYFAGRLTAFQVPLDWRLVRSGFARRVLEATARVPYGRTATYAQVATAAGSPTATRAAGRALGSNPLPVVVPCHRVLRTDGGVGGYRGGLDAKRFLLTHEGAAPAAA